MIQRCIELGDGYADVYELFELARRMPDRINYYLALHTEKKDQQLTSLALIMKPGAQGNFQPIYLCLEGVPNPALKQNKRFDLFRELAEANGHTVRELIVKPSSSFHEKNLYYQYLLGIFQMNRFLKIA